jgi:hypothetical protein
MVRSSRPPNERLAGVAGIRRGIDRDVVIDRRSRVLRPIAPVFRVREVHLTVHTTRLKVRRNRCSQPRKAFETGHS